MNKAQVVEFFHRLAADNPHPETELEYGNPYQLLVAVALSAQMTDVGVNRATRPLFAEVATPQAMLALGHDRLRAAIQSINFNNTKAKNVIALSEALVAQHGGQVPEDRAALRRCPGSAARPPTSCSTRHSGTKPSRSTPTSSASATAPAWRAARPRWRSNSSWRKRCRDRSACTLITG